MRDLAASRGRQVRVSRTWIHVVPADASDRLRPHGWKLHIACRAVDLPDVTERLVPVLLDEGCSFKLARSQGVLSTLNSNRQTPAAVGKAFTVYPDEAEVRRLGLELADLLQGQAGPEVLSDRRVRPGAPVYYRYGPFRQELVAHPNGNLVSMMTGPDGTEFAGTADLVYRQPPWAVDPFTGSTGFADDDRFGYADTAPAETLGEHYRVVKGLHSSVCGDVFRAVDVRTDEDVAVKQARPHIGESYNGVDAVLRLRNERFVLQALGDVPGVPRFVDHFAQGGDEFLVMTFAGKLNLLEDIVRNGRYRPAASGARSLDVLAHRLATIVSDLHARGFVLGDVTPRNVVVKQRPGFPVTIVDFGQCNHGEVHIPGGTPGYAPPHQVDGTLPDRSSDCYGLAATLFHAATGAMPPIDTDTDAARHRLRQAIAGIYRSEVPAVVGELVELIDPDPGRATAALRRLRDGTAAPPEAVALPGPGTLGLAEVGTLADAVLDRMLSRLSEMLDSDGRAVDLAEANAYDGTAGIGLELLHHTGHPRVPEILRRLGEHAARSAEQTRLRPGLLTGSTGVEIFLRRLRRAGIDAPLLPRGMVLDDAAPEGDDIMVGAAGLGLGHLLLHELDPDPGHERIVRRCLDVFTDHFDTASVFAETGTEVVGAGMELDVGIVHGQAGVITFLLAAADAGLDVAGTGLEQRIGWLAGRGASMIRRSTDATAVPLCTSWCRGMAGIGHLLLDLARRRDDPEPPTLAVLAGERCSDWIPYLSSTSRCCGITGVGIYLAELAGPHPRFGEAALDAIVQLRLRGGLGPAATAEPALSWSRGDAGTLELLRRLRDGTTSGGVAGPL